MGHLRGLALRKEDGIGWPSTVRLPAGQLNLFGGHGNQMRGRRGRRVAIGEILAAL